MQTDNDKSVIAAFKELCDFVDFHNKIFLKKQSQTDSEENVELMSLYQIAEDEDWLYISNTDFDPSVVTKYILEYSISATARSHYGFVGFSIPDKYNEVSGEFIEEAGVIYIPGDTLSVEETLINVCNALKADKFYLIVKQFGESKNQ